MINFIKVDELLPVRNLVLRNGLLTPDECRFPSDGLAGNFHLGYFVNDELACVASFHPQAYGDFSGAGYQLRGMATIEKYRGQGLGSQLVTFALNYLGQLQAGYLWCNARQKAVRFYEGLGMEVISPVFEVPGIGPHYVMYVKIK